MKNQKIKMIITVLALFFVTNIFAQASAIKSVDIQTSAVCGMCKKTIETALENTEGIKLAMLNDKTKVVTVRYYSDKTTEEAVRNAITMIGYNADTIPADDKAYENLHDCCKKDAKE
ncbi:MAG: cation transporter [Fimbriimonadaceae bacterium]|nr:cation transporter [Chitinophagales bacterium]